MDGAGHYAIAAHDSAAMDEAIHGLERRAPGFSARRRITPAQGIVLAAALLAAIVLAGLSLIDGGVILAVARGGLTCAFAALIAMRFVAASRAALASSVQAERRDAPPPTPPGPRRASRRAEAARLPVYTVLCPLYREPAVAAQLLAALRRLDYPTEKLDVKLITEIDDLDTLEALRSAGLPNWIEVVVTPAEGPRTKPKALNFALARARGAFVCVFDAEDDPHPLQLRAAHAAFDVGGARLGCVQAPLVIANGAQSWIAAQFAAEYAIQFGQTLPLYAAIGAPFAIGGTSNHFRAAALAEAGAWDPYNVTEDADLGFRLARMGWTMAMIAQPTLESAPTTAAAWVRQRTRWIKGHLQTWLVLMRDPRATCRGMGLGAFLAMQMQMGGGLLSAFAHGPLAVALALGAAAGIEVDAAAWALAMAGYASAAYGALVCAVTAREPRVLWAALTMPLYWPLASIAAVRALIELIVAPHYWAKTDHTPRAPCDPARADA